MKLYEIDLNEIQDIETQTTNGELGNLLLYIQYRPSTDIIFRKFRNGKSISFAKMKSIKEHQQAFEILKGKIR